MKIPQPEHISREALAERLRREVLLLTGAESDWWTAHSVSPFPVAHGAVSHFVVASKGSNILFFADDEDEFGVARLAVSSQRMTDYGLIGDLRDAVRVIQTMVT